MVTNFYLFELRAPHSGKKVLDTILLAWPLVAFALGLKYGRLLGPHGSPTPPHG